MTTPPKFPPFPPWPEPAVTGLVDPTDEPIDFTPVPRQRKRRNGWTEPAQRAFIAALEQCGCVARSARAVGISPRSVYRLLEAEGADSFAAAVDQAIARGVERVRGDAMPTRAPRLLGAGRSPWARGADGISPQRPPGDRHPLGPRRLRRRAARAGDLASSLSAPAQGASTGAGRGASPGGRDLGRAPGDHRQPAARARAAHPEPLEPALSLSKEPALSLSKGHEK